MADMLNKWVEVGHSTATVVLGIAWANGLVLDVPILSMIPAIVHTIAGWAVAGLGVAGIFLKLSKK